MSGDHVTLRIPKKAIFATVALLIPVAFAGGIVIGGRDSSTGPDTIAPTSVVMETSSTSSSVPTSVASKSVTTTTTAKKKKKSAPATTTTTTLAPKLGITGTYEDNCPAPNLANPNAGRVPGTITIKWQSTAATKVTLRVFHGADKLYDGQVNELSGQMAFENKTCNNVRLADGSYNGKPLVVTYLLSAYDAAGTLFSANGEGQF